MKNFVSHIKQVICFILCIAVCIAFTCIALVNRDNVSAEEEALIRIWQIDSFEGGKGSRADFLQKAGNEFSDKNGCYVSVVALSAEAARLNLAQGNIPDLISYGAGTFGIESYISGYRTWCYGGYCLITLDSNADFTDADSENTVINEGKDNFAAAAALMCGLQGADCEKPTGAYVKLINGNYKYLLGTQRDIYRLKTRGANFTVKPISEFNDLYQNISITSSGKYVEYANKYIDYLFAVSDSVTKLGLLSDGAVYDDEMKIMQGINYDYVLTAPVSEATRKQLENLISGGDINMLKNLLK